MEKPDYVGTYNKHLTELVREHGRERAMELVVGGNFVETGILESSLLIHLGLAPNHTVIDIGCGSGRLAYSLRDFLKGKFIGTDILDEALKYAREKCGRPDWVFTANHLPTIPVADSSADFVTFFSVFTHLLDEDTYRFLREAKRVLKRDGRIIFSFLDFGCDMHWPTFVNMVDNPTPSGVLNKFITKLTIDRWARSLGLRVEEIRDGSEKWIPVANPASNDDGTRFDDLASFGQSVTVLSVFREEDYLARYPDVKTAIELGHFRSAEHHYDLCGKREGRTR